MANKLLNKALSASYKTHNTCLRRSATIYGPPGGGIMAVICHYPPGGFTDIREEYRPGVWRVGVVLLDPLTPLRSGYVLRGVGEGQPWVLRSPGYSQGSSASRLTNNMTIS